MIYDIFKRLTETSKFKKIIHLTYSLAFITNTSNNRNNIYKIQKTAKRWKNDKERVMGLGN